MERVVNKINCHIWPRKLKMRKYIGRMVKTQIL